MSNPKVCVTTIRKARKVHRCCECFQSIQIGEKYSFTSGIWDDPESFKQCLGCDSIVTAVLSYCRYFGIEDGPEYNGLADFVLNSFDTETAEDIHAITVELGVEPAALRRLLKIEGSQ